MNHFPVLRTPIGRVLRWLATRRDLRVRADVVRVEIGKLGLGVTVEGA